MNSQAPRTSTEPSFSASGSDDEIDLLALLGTLWRAKWLILLCAMLSASAGVYYLMKVATPTYVATAIVALEDAESQVIDLESLIPGVGTDQSAINTEIEVIRSRELMLNLVEDRGLANDPFFNPTLVPPSPYSPGVLLRRALGTPPPPPMAEQQIRDLVVDRVLAQLSVSNIRQSYVFQIRIETDDPRKSADLADRLAELYIDAQLAAKFDATESAIGFLSERATRLQSDLESAETAVKDFATNNDLVTRETLALKNRQLAELRDRQASNLAQSTDLQARLIGLEALRSSTDPLASLEGMDEPELLLLARRIGTRGYDLADFQASLDGVIRTVRQDADRASNQVAVLGESADRLRADIERESDNLLVFEQLQREAEANRLLYEYFLSRLKEAAVQQGIQQPDARILSRASIPRSKASPRSSLVLALSVILGGMLGAGLALVREMRTSTIRTAEELEQTTGLVVAGQIPRATFRRRKDLMAFLVEKANSPFAEAIRNLRTSILLSNVDTPPQIIMLTSSTPGEGKTTIALSLSQNLGKLGKKVLLIEADIRRRTFSEYFEVEGQANLVESVMAAEDGAIAVSDKDSMPGVDIVFGGKAAINAADFFSSEKFDAYLKAAREQYDYVVIDTPPVLVVPDARIIGRHADAIIYCVHWDKTPKAQPVNGIRSFDAINLKVHSVVLSQVDPAGLKRYGYGDRYGSYGSGASGYYDT